MRQQNTINISIKKQNISNETAEIVKFHFSHYNSMGTLSCHSNQSSYPTGTKTQLFDHLPVDATLYMCKLKIIGFTPSEEKSFENVDDGRTDDGYFFIL